MGSHPINLAIRFLLEMAALLSLGFWGWSQSEGWFGFVLAVGIPMLLAIIWGVFAVPNDPSRSGSAPIKTPGPIRLAIELGIFALAVWALFDLEFCNASLVFGSIVLLHYLLSYDRVVWLMSQSSWKEKV